MQAFTFVLQNPQKPHKNYLYRSKKTGIIP